MKELPKNLLGVFEQVKRFPTSPGIYIMKNDGGDVIYVGKAKNIKDRVRSYFGGGDKRFQLSFLLENVVKIETIGTATERQAFILERDFISRYKPRYNIRLKDDKAYLSIRVDLDRPWPRLELVRRIENDGARYFGPYAFSYELRQLLDIINKSVPLRTCADTVFHNRQRPCLEYQIKRCAGPCCLDVDRSQYIDWVKQAMRILEGDVKGLVSELKIKMEKASTSLLFEEAAAIRDRLLILEQIEGEKEFIAHRAQHQDAFGVYREAGLASVCVLHVRNGKISGSKNFTFQDVLIDDSELIRSVVSQFYEGRSDLPAEILLPVEVEEQDGLEQFLSEASLESLSLICPKRGSKHSLISLAQLNARQHFVVTFEKETRNTEILKELAKILRLPQIPRRIECIDISNLQGSDIVSGLVSFMDGVADKSRYRKFKISFEEDKPNDFEAIYEVTYRRLSRGRDEGDLPDLLVIDGGKGQLSSACRARDELGINIDIVSLAKMRLKKQSSKQLDYSPERIFLEKIEEPIILKEGDEVTKFMARLRDEAHRFSITFHRAKRATRVFKSIIDDIPGVGASRRQRLLAHYGSVETMKKAKVEELAKIGRMPVSLANKLFAAIQGKI